MRRSSAVSSEYKQRKPGWRKRQRPIESIVFLSSSDSDGNSSDSLSIIDPLPGSKKNSNGSQKNHNNHPKQNKNDGGGDDDNKHYKHSVASKRITEKFLAKAANSKSVKESVDIYQMVVESDGDSSSNGSDLGRMLGFSVGSGRGENSASDSNSNSDSSIEIFLNPLTSLAPVGMNGRRLRGRHRRLEILRSKNSAAITRGATTDSTEQPSHASDEDMIHEIDNDEHDDDSPVDHGKTSNDGALVSTESPASSKTNGAKTSSSAATTTASEKPPQPHDKTSEFDKTNTKSTKGSSKLTQGPESISAETTHKKDTGRKSTRPKKTKRRQSAVFDNLLCNGKDFMSWAGITDPNYFLEHHKQYVSKVDQWRTDRGLPSIKNPEQYIKKLRIQVKKNLKQKTAKAAKKQANRAIEKDTSSKKKVKKRRKSNQKTVYPPVENLPMEGGNFVKDMQINDILEIFKRKDLHKYVNKWRKTQNLPPVDNERSCVAEWRKWIRQNMEYKPASLDADDTPKEIDFSSCMEVIECLSKRFLNRKTGLPVYQFAVYDTLSTDIIYEFRVEAKPSLIPNAGNGAFLTFLGAREASCPGGEPDSSSEVKIIQPLVSRDSEGYHMNIRITGDNLWDGEKCTQYPPPTSLPPVHEPSEKLTVDASDKYPWTLQPDAESILSRYVENSEIDFSTNRIGCSVIEIGRYGPFRRSDRKYQLHYDLKNFVFSNEVSEWGFDVEEDLNGHDQVADVTDDLTGMPHHITKQNICMYVNETGGNPKLKQTVWSGQVSDREVNYYFQTETPMKKGERIELLISYLDTYDEIRERKGYGERNKSGDVRGDNHFATFIERNFVERYDMVEVIYEVDTLLELYLLSEFLENIRMNLATVVDGFVGQLQASSEELTVPYAQQIIALRRLNWLKPFFLKKIKSFEERKSPSIVEDSVLRQCVVNSGYLEWPSWSVLMDLLEKHPNLVDGRGINVRSKFRAEVTEDICYGASRSLMCPCNEAVWCNAASTLIQDLCYIIARDRWNCANLGHSAKLGEAIMQRTIEASKPICYPETVEPLYFDTDIWKRYALNDRGLIAKEPSGTKCLMVLSTDCKGPEKRLPVPYIIRGNLSMVPRTGILSTIHKPWYLVRQILFLADTFAKEYLADDRSYSSNVLRERLGVTPEAASMFYRRGIELDLDSTLFFGEYFDSTYSTGNKLPVIKKGRRLIKPKTILFWDVLIERLKKELGWKIERGNRAHDFYVLPPGVERGKGFKPRIDFFDSEKLVVQCLEHDTRYCNIPLLKAIMKEYEMCKIELNRMRATKSIALKTLSRQELVQHLRKKVSSQKNQYIKVVFESDQLGLLLRVNDGQVLVQGVVNINLGNQINAEDAMIAVGDHCTRMKPLADVCGLIRAAGRPVTITFERKV